MTNKIQLVAIVLLNMLFLSPAQGQTINANIPNNTADSRYIDHGDSTVTDTVTDLMWQKCSVGQSGSSCSIGSATRVDWKEGLQLPSVSTVAGYSNWRLPNAEELHSLVAYDRYRPSINTAVFPSTIQDDYWSSSPAAFSDSAGSYSLSWEVDFMNGDYLIDSRNQINYIRLVRSGQ
ncbi:MAG: hypothetical protein ACJA0M_000766 [Chitinophagales bacterium]|jgi:hypothetical protein